MPVQLQILPDTGRLELDADVITPEQQATTRLAWMATCIRILGISILMSLGNVVLIP